MGRVASASAPGGAHAAQLAILALAQCGALEQAASDLLASVNQCETDADCSVASVFAPCLSAFLCYSSVNESTDLESLRQQAELLAAEYGKAACGCVMADCVDPEILEAYPGSHNGFTRRVDLTREFPGAYKGEKNWLTHPPNVDFDYSLGLLAVGPEENLDQRNHLDLSEFLFEGIA